jgi:hypothetical protein
MHASQTRASTSVCCSSPHQAQDVMGSTGHVYKTNERAHSATGSRVRANQSLFYLQVEYWAVLGIVRWLCVAEYETTW